MKDIAGVFRCLSGLLGRVVGLYGALLDVSGMVGAGALGFSFVG